MATPVEDEATDDSLVLVTGASGFLGSQVVNVLLSKGYRVRGTVRSKNNEVKVKPLLRLCPEAKHPLELVEADLAKQETWDPAVCGCSYVIHTAHPFPAERFENGDEVIRENVGAVEAILRACQKHRVKRVVLTSSIAAIFDLFSNDTSPGKVFTEEDWTDPDTANDSYVKSKTLVEREAWNFVRNLPDDERFELSVVNPAGIFGPVLCGSIGTTAMMVQMMLNGQMVLVPRLCVCGSDVRDVALAHLRAMTYPGAAGQRIIVGNGRNVWAQDMAKLLDSQLGPQGYSVSTSLCPFWLFEIASWFNGMSRMFSPLWDKELLVDASKMRRILKITPIQIEQTVIDMAYSLIEGGFVKKTKLFQSPSNGNNELN